MSSNTLKLFIYTALACEAKPVVEHFKLKKEITIQPFDVYLGKDICLTVTGVGKSAMAAGVGYTQALFHCIEPFIMLNLGVSGHKEHALGDLFIIDKITDFDSQRRYYPSLVFSLPYPTESVLTVSKPQLDYDSLQLFDMEASAFYETAVRFCSSEFIFCLKVISDNQMSSVENIQPKQISQWIGSHVEVLNSLWFRIEAQTKLISNSEPLFFKYCIQRYHFTVNERQQLNNLLTHWNILTNHKDLEINTSSIKSAKEILRWLDLEIQGINFYL